MKGVRVWVRRTGRVKRCAYVYVCVRARARARACVCVCVCVVHVSLIGSKSCRFTGI